MSVKHKIKDKTGKIIGVNLTPLRAIRLQCLECLAYSAKEVRNCTNKHCSLYPYRLGRNPSIKREKGICNAIKNKCK